MQIHIVRYGETLFSVAGKVAISADRLAEENALHRPTHLLPGQSLLYARPARTRAARAGETPEQICREEGVALRRLLRQNPYIAATGELHPGQEVATVQESAPFGSLSVYGFLPDSPLSEATRASLPYLTVLLLCGCHIDEEGVLLPATAGALTRISPDLLPVLWGVVPISDISRACPTRLSESMRATGIRGLCAEITVPESVTEKERRAATDTALSLSENGLGFCLCGHWQTGDTTAPMPGWGGFLRLDRAKEPQGLAALCRRIVAAVPAADRRFFAPALCGEAEETCVLPNGERQTQAADTAEMLHAAVCRRIAIEREAESQLAHFSFRTCAGRQAVRHDVRYEDAYAFSQGLFEMNRAGLCAVCCEAGRVPIWKLYGLSLCYDIIDG